MTKTDRVQKLQDSIAQFAAARNWTQFHSPKNLAMALTVEVSELLEIFQWMSQEQSYRPGRRATEHIAEEIGDIMIYLSMIADCFDLDPVSAAESKLALNQARFPAPPVPDTDRKTGQE